MNNTLTHAEEQLMLKLWGLEKASVKELLEEYPEPKPAYNTVSTIVRILERKKVVTHIKKGRGYYYIPLLSKKDYRINVLNHLIINYYDMNFQLLNSEINETKTLECLL
jgi:predicted transcriptional regulator